MLKNLLLSVAAAAAFALPTLAQDGYQAATADVSVTTDVLKLQLRPLQAAEVEVEANAWQTLLARKASEISAAEIAAKTGGAAPDTSTLRSEQRAILERLEVVLAALRARGGDSKSFDQYIAAATATDLADASALMTNVTEWVTAEDGGIKMGLNVLKFLVTLFVFSLIARIAAGIVRKAIARMKNTSELLRDFFVNATRRIVFFIGVIVALSMLNIDVTPFVAALGAAGFVIGFALQGTLSNFASGLMILVYRPYDIGEVVTVAGTTGKVDAMTLVSTTLRLPDNQTVVIPNNSIWGDVITNITGQETRRVDMVFGCGYGDDLQKTQDLLTEIVKGHEKVLADPEPVVKVHELADSSVNFVVRPWAKTGDYWDVFWDVTRAVKERFDAEGLNIPFPQRDVHVHQVNG